MIRFLTKFTGAPMWRCRCLGFPNSPIWMSYREARRVARNAVFAKMEYRGDFRD